MTVSWGHIQGNVGAVYVHGIDYNTGDIDPDFKTMIWGDPDSVPPKPKGTEAAVLLTTGPKHRVHEPGVVAYGLTLTGYIPQYKAKDFYSIRQMIDRRCRPDRLVCGDAVIFDTPKDATVRAYKDFRVTATVHETGEVIVVEK